jgi:hypothetical protein
MRQANCRQGPKVLQHKPLSILLNFRRVGNKHVVLPSPVFTPARSIKPVVTTVERAPLGLQRYPFVAQGPGIDANRLHSSDG